MLKKIFLSLVMFLVFLPNQTYAADQFAENYTVKYLIQDNGDALVTEQVKIRNLKDGFYASNYTSAVPVENVGEISASIGKAKLDVIEKNENGKKLITVDFPEQVIGKDKEYSWTLSYRLRNFVKTNGAIKQFNVPKLTPITNLEQYNVIVSIPLGLGEPTQIIPKPVSQKDVADQTEYQFSKEQIELGGISSIFGSSQTYNFNQEYSLNNPNLLPAVLPIFIPGSGLFQEIIISDISPKPENVVIDQNGNSLAYFKVDRLETKKITVQGKAKVDLERSSVDIPDQKLVENLTKHSGVWDANSPQVQKALELAFEGQNNLSTIQKAQKIYEYVTSVISFGDYGVTNQFSQSSASSVLSDPKNRFCSDYVNVTIALLRAAQIPAEQVVGTVYTNGDVTKPSCYETKDQHTWVRFLDVQKGWVYMDPSWGAAGNGLTFFDASDLSHVATAYLSQSENNAQFAQKSFLEYANDEFLPVFSLQSDILAPKELLSGFPYTITFRLSNSGNSVLPPGSFMVNARYLQLKPKDGKVNNNEFMYPSIPPFGYVDYEFTTKSGLAWEGFEDVISFTADNAVTNHVIAVKPLFSSKFFSAIVLGLTFLMLGLYILSLVLHYRSKSISEVTEEVLEDISKVIAPIVPSVKISGSSTKNVIKEKKVKNSKSISTRGKFKKKKKS